MHPIAPPARVPWLLRPALWITARLTGKTPLPARLLTHLPKAALGAGIFELVTPHGPRDLEGRVLAAARLVASAVSGCPFCVDMNAAAFARSGLSVDELRALVMLERERWAALGERPALAARYAEALSRTPVQVAPDLEEPLRARFSERELVVLAFTVAQVNFWARFNQGLGVPSAGFFDQRTCALPPAR